MLAARALYCRRQQRVLFDALDVTAEAGQIVQLTGANGSGKSTLLRILAGLYSGFSGDIEFDGVPVAADRWGFAAPAYTSATGSV